MEIDLEINNEKRNKWSAGEFRLYFLEHKDIDFNPLMYATGLPTDAATFTLQINEFGRGKPNMRTGRPHIITAKIP
jgi:hypothetical protein